MQIHAVADLGRGSTLRRASGGKMFGPPRPLPVTCDHISSTRLASDRLCYSSIKTFDSLYITILNMYAGTIQLL